MRNKISANHVHAYSNINSYLTTQVFRLCIQRLDNDYSYELKFFLSSNDVTLQLAPLKNHRFNSSERDILTFKNRFIANLIFKYPQFPIRLW